MQSAFTFFDNPKEKPKVTTQSSLVITERDLEILSFVHEMKFASLDDLHFKFFRVLKDGVESKSLWWARERLTDLAKFNYLARVYSFAERKSYFLGTEKAYLTLIKRCPSKLPVRPLERIDFNTFDHDKLIIQVRLALENSGVANNWQSDRKLFQYPELCLNLGNGNQPDAIYTTPTGEKVAFELEVSRKAKKRYYDKIRTYAYLLREQKSNPQAFKKVHFVIANESVRDLILQETKIYPQYFSVQMLSEVLSGN